MSLFPSVVVGLGTSGASVIANIERIFYEVLGDTRLDLLRLLIIETDTRQRDFDMTPGGRISQMVDAHENDVGQAIKNLKAHLSKDFAWCPDDLNIQGHGAGNVRAGGRLMFHSKFPGIQKALSDAIQEAVHSSTRTKVQDSIDSIFSQRGLPPPQGIVDAGTTVVYVVGTLAGGTCSGMCVDFGYAVHQVDPQAHRVGIFFVPDGDAALTFRENAWAALTDLGYFCEHPGDFKGVWLSEGLSTFPYSGQAAKPYDHIYLLSSRNENAQTRLAYSGSMDSPLVVMAATQIAADLLGLYSIRSGKLVNLNQHVTGSVKRQTFLNFNLRGVSYPKYEISEAAACKIVADTICGSWLDDRSFLSTSGVKSPILEDNIRDAGREHWNRVFRGIWTGAFASVGLEESVTTFMDSRVDDPVKALRQQFAGNVTGTLYSKVAQTLPLGISQLEKDVRRGVLDAAAEWPNVRCVELFVQGMVDEIGHTSRFWDGLAVPEKGDEARWAGVVQGMLEQIAKDKNNLATWSIGARLAAVREGLEGLLTRLAMYLMRDTLERTRLWIDSEILTWAQKLRNAQQWVRDAADSRSKTILGRIASDRSGPILRLSRSKSEGFADEIDRLAKSGAASTDVRLLKAGADSTFEGLFSLRGTAEGLQQQRLLIDLKNLVQPGLRDALSKKGSVNIAEQLRDQNQVSFAANYLKEALKMSLATNPQMQKALTAVPSYVIARDASTAQMLLDNIRQNEPSLQPMQAEDLPIFDHMALFYQEGANFDPSTLQEVSKYESAYRERLATGRADFLDPLAYMKQTPEPRGETS